MATNLATLNVSIVGNGSALRVDLRQNEAALKRFGKQATTTGSVLKNAFSVALGNLGSAAFRRGVQVVTQGLRSLVTEGLRFNEAFQQSIAIQTTLSKGLEQELRAVAVDTAFRVKASADQVAAGFFFLASAGQTAEQQLQSIGFASKFAQAGAFDLALAVDLLTDAQSALGLVRVDPSANLQQLTRVGDVLVKANTLANASVQQFSESLTTKAGPALRALGIEIEEGVAVLSVFADQGVKAAEAGTQTAIVLRDLTTKAILNKKAFAELGIAVFDGFGEFRKFSEVIGDIERSLQGLSDEAAKKRLIDLGFSDKSLGSLQTLLGTSEKIANYESALLKAAGTTETVSRRQFTDFSEATNRLRASWEQFGITLTESRNVIVPAINDISLVIQNASSIFERFDRLIKEGVSTPAAIGASFAQFFGLVDKGLPALTRVETAKLARVRADALRREFELQDFEELTLQFALPRVLITEGELLRDVLGEQAEELERQAAIIKEGLLTPIEKFRNEFEQLNKIRAIKAFGEDTEEFFGRAIEKIKAEFVDSSLSLTRAAEQIKIQERKSFVEGTQRGSIGDLANRIAGLDAAIGTRQQAKPEDIERNRLLVQANLIAQQQLEEQKKAEVVALKISETDLQ